MRPVHKLRVLYSDGKSRGGLLKLWTIDPTARRIWDGRPAVGFREQLVAPEDGAEEWLLLRFSNKPEYEWNADGQIEIDHASVAIAYNPAERAADGAALAEWFRGQGVPVPEDVIPLKKGGRGPASEAEASGQGEAPHRSPREDKEAEALGLLAKHSEWTKKKIAETVGVHRSTLDRWPRFKAGDHLVFHHRITTYDDERPVP